MIRRILRWLFSPAPLRCSACGMVHPTAETLYHDYPSGATCVDYDACWQRRRNGEAMKQSARHSLPPDFDDDCDGWYFDKGDDK